MRMTLLGGVLLMVLALGVVEANRSGQEGSRLSRWMESEAPVPEPAATPRTPQPAAPPETPAAEPSVLAAGEISVLGEDAPEPVVPMVRYFDSAGSLHMVRGLDRVPPEHRADAVVVGRGNVNLVRAPAPTAAAFRDWQPAPNPNRTNVVLFSAPWCGACRSAKRHLDARGVAYQERDIDDDPSAKEEVRRILGRIAIPLLDVDGRYISGFRPDVYDRALGSG